MQELHMAVLRNEFERLQGELWVQPEPGMRPAAHQVIVVEDIPLWDELEPQ